MKIPIPSDKITDKQLQYIESLTSQLNFTRIERDVSIADLIGREIDFLHELSKKEASNVISRFKELSEEMDEDLDDLGARYDDEPFNS